MIQNTKNQDPMLVLLDAMSMGGSEAIYAQEARGQKQLVASSQLPAEANEREKDARKYYEAMGLKVFGPSKNDSLFVDVQLPEGWEIKPTDHSMWSTVFDGNGRERMNIFYKAAFYDRKAHVDVCRRYCTDYVGHPTDQNMSKRVVKDRLTGEILLDNEMGKYGGESGEKCEAWLNANFPMHRDPLAYWND